MRLAAWCGATLAGALLLGVASALLALASLGVFASPPGAWTTELEIAGFNARMNVAGLVRLATLPGTAHLLDGRLVQTRSGTLRFARDGDALRVTCAPCRLQHRNLASGPVLLRSVELEVRREGDALDGAVVVDTIRIPFDARLRAASIDLAWQLPPTELASVNRALGDAVPEAAFAHIEGTVQAQGALSLPSGRGSARWSAEGLEVGGLGTEALQHGWFRFACGDPSGRAKLTITGDGEQAWIATDAMGPYLAAAVLAAEDQRLPAARRLRRARGRCPPRRLRRRPSKARRQHDHATAGADALHRRRTDRRAQAPRAALRDRDGAHARQGAHPRAVPEHGGLGAGPVRRARRGPRLLRQGARAPLRARGRVARRACCAIRTPRGSSSSRRASPIARGQRRC